MDNYDSCIPVGYTFKLYSHEDPLNKEEHWKTNYVLGNISGFSKMGPD